MNDDDTPRFPVRAYWGNQPDSADVKRGDIAAMVEAMRSFLDSVTGSAPDAATIEAVTAGLAVLSARLDDFHVDEAQQIFGRQSDISGRGQTMSPRLFIEHADASHAEGRVTFGRYYLGGNGAAHGGAIPLVFDEIMGRLANCADRAPSRTAYLNVDFRSITPIEKPLQIRAWIEHEEGRKRFLRAELRDGAILCAEAKGLFVVLKPGQP